MRKDVREVIRRLKLSASRSSRGRGHYRVLRDGEPLRTANGMPFTLPFSRDTIRSRRAAVIELRKLGIDPGTRPGDTEARRPFGHRASPANTFSSGPAPVTPHVRRGSGQSASLAAP